jgi:hypothetical protein
VQWWEQRSEPWWEQQSEQLLVQQTEVLLPARAQQSRVGIVGGIVPPGVIEIVSIEIYPENEVPRVAIHFTDLVPVDSIMKAWVHALVSAACCALHFGTL